jgi:hypothetical protein
VLGVHHLQDVGKHGPRRPARLPGGDVVDHVDDVEHVLLGDGDDHVFLAGEVPVDRAGRQPRLGEQVLHGRGVKAVAQEAAPRRAQDLIPAGVPVLLCDLRHAPIIQKKRAFVLIFARGCCTLRSERERSFPITEVLAMRNPLAAHPPWRQLIIISVVLPLAIVLAVLAFAWPAARIAPRSLPVGIVGAGPASEQVAQGLTRADPGGFDVRLFPSQASARSAIEDRDVYGAFVLTGRQITVLEASAASPTVAQLLSTVGGQLARAEAVAGAAVQVKDVDLVPTSATDPRGLVLSSAVLPMTICGVIMAAAIGLVLAFRPAWRQILALVVVSATVGLGSYLIAQGFLGALPNEHVATWAAISLTMLAIGATTAGLIAMVGARGLGLGAALMIFIGNPFSGVTSAPQLLPTAVGYIGQWLPPGAGANLLRSTAYFHGHGAAGHLTVLIVWSVLGIAAIVLGHHGPIRFAASTASTAKKPASQAPGQHMALT